MVEEKDNVWETLQGTKKGFSINETLKPNFLDEIEKAFANYDVDAISLVFYIKKKKNDIEDDVISSSDGELISISHRTDEDTKNKRIIVDVRDASSYEKVKSVIDNY